MISILIFFFSDDFFEFCFEIEGNVTVSGSSNSKMLKIIVLLIVML